MKRSLLGKLQATHRELPTSKCSTPWEDLAVFLAKGRKYRRITPTPWSLERAESCPKTGAMRGVVWLGRLFERGFLGSGKGQPMEVEMLDVRNPLPESLDEKTLTKITSPVSWAMVAWRYTIRACTKSRSYVGSIGMERVRSGSTEYLQRRRANGRKKIVYPVRRSIGRWAVTGST